MLDKLFIPLLTCTLSCFSIPSYGQSASGSDIFLADLSQDNGVLQVSNHRNITSREGYDNQPFFLTDGEHLLYTSAIVNGEKSQTDVIMYNIKKKQAVNISLSPESEYSPTPMLNGLSYSMIRVGSDGKQKLWSYALNGANKSELIKDVEPVGYHAWVDEDNVVLFVLGEPHRFELASISSGKSIPFDSDIGASLFKIPGTELMSYTRNITQNPDKPPVWEITQFNATSKQKRGLVNLPEGAYYYAWSPDAKALAAAGGKLMQWTYSEDKGKTGWVEFADVSKHCPKGASRMAVNSGNTLLAYVCER